jgi:hypothetical protein
VRRPSPGVAAPLCRALVMGALGAVFLAAACAGAPSSPVPSVSPISACQQAFALAAGVALGSDDPAHLDPTIAACASQQEWLAGARSYPAAVTGTEPEAFLADRCLNGPPDIAETSLCRGLRIER